MPNYASEEQQATLPARVLCVDDNFSARKLWSAILDGDERFELSLAPTGAEALHKARREQPSLILLDLDLPDVDGFEVIRRLKRGSATATIPVIAVSGVYDPAPAFLENAGFAGFVAKPLDDIAAVTELLVSKLDLAS